MLKRHRFHPLAAPSFNGRTSASGAGYRGSNPWGAANTALLRTSLNLPVHGAQVIAALCVTGIKDILSEWLSPANLDR
jgi:hypothetical protein